MKTIENAPTDRAQAMASQLAQAAGIVLLPNRYPELAEAALSQIGVNAPTVPKRVGSASTEGRGFFWCGGRDIPRKVARAAWRLDPTTVGVTGGEWFLERQASFVQDGLFGFSIGANIGALALLATNDTAQTVSIRLVNKQEKPVKVVTPFPNLTEFFAAKDALNLRIGEVITGGAEGSGDLWKWPIVDLTASGASKTANNLTEVRRFMTVPQVLVASFENPIIQNNRQTAEALSLQLDLIRGLPFVPSSYRAPSNSIH